jgi:hypothetical protein
LRGKCHDLTPLADEKRITLNDDGIGAFPLHCGKTALDLLRGAGVHRQDLYAKLRCRSLNALQSDGSARATGIY